VGTKGDTRKVKEGQAQSGRCNNRGKAKEGIEPQESVEKPPGTGRYYKLRASLV
jgi:hypothetical protein